MRLSSVSSPGRRCHEVFHWCSYGFTKWLLLSVAMMGSSFWGFRAAEGGRNCGGYDIRCVNGQCVDESLARSRLNNDSRSNDVNKTPKVICQCDQWWSGPSCDIYACSGRMFMQSSDGNITDGTANYSTYNKCTWLIDSGSVLPIRFEFEEFATECGWDHLYIYDGTSTSHPLLAVLSGLIIPQSSQGGVIPEVTAASGSAYIYFYSDAAYNMSGFRIRYSYALCSLNCSGHGQCLVNGTCICGDGWTGVGCDVPICPKNCSFPNGSCAKDGCQCNPEHRGIDCSVPINKGVWTNIEYTASDVLEGVSSHASFVYQNYLWIVGGYNFVTTDHLLKITRYNFDSQLWEDVKTQSDVTSGSPLARYGHSVVIYNESMYMFGGVIDNTITDEFWKLDLSTTGYQWQLQLLPNTSQTFKTVGHSAEVAQSLMFVFFGYNPEYGYLNLVQCYSFENQTWEVLTTSGAIVKGGYGHSSVHDSVNGTILIHGGYLSESASSYSLTDAVYAFDPVNFSWEILRGSGQFKYLHSAAILGRYMFVFGGNTHNDTSVSHGAKCYSSSFMAYDIDCDRWYVLDTPSYLSNAARFGHSADVFNDEMYVFGGFNGFILNDLLWYQTGNCSGFTKDNCLSAREGIKCILINQANCSTIEDAYDTKTVRIDQASCDPAPEDTCEKDKLKSCLSCTVNSQECIWCGNKCQSKQSLCESPEAGEEQCLANSSRSVQCPYLHNCHACGLDTDCVWSSQENKCDLSPSQSLSSNMTCELPCSTHTTCENCTLAACMWCGNEHRCFDSNAYVISFPYGQCMEWTNLSNLCPATRCPDLRTCAQCMDHPSCGWCDDGTDTGLGWCMDGGLDGPFPNATKQCPSDQWNFKSCPICQCNGHSNCSVNSSTCIACGGMTTGDQCEQCQSGFWGLPLVGGNCTACECNDQADFCNPNNGSCYCSTRGVIGDHCQECDKAHKYYGDPSNGGTCYYELAIDWVFTFNLSSEENKYYTQINFMNTPPSKDKDVDFSINCSYEASMNMSVKSVGSEEQVLFVNHSCRSFTAKFSHKEFSFGTEQNTTFLVYVYNFQTPFVVQIYFSQNEQLDLFRFFITFFSCFFSLLLIAFVSWKLKQRYDQYRRGQRHIQEMAQMANRPFSSCTLELQSAQDHSIPVPVREQPDRRSSARRKRECKATPITVEPLFGQKAAVLSVIVRLPKGDEDYTPWDQSALAIGSALVTLGGHSRQSNAELSKADRTGKHRKKPTAAISSAGSANAV